MSDRRVQKQVQNQVNEKYWETRNSLQKMFNAGQISAEELQANIDSLNKINKQHQDKIAGMGDDLTQLNRGKSITIKQPALGRDSGMFSNIKSKLKSTADDIGSAVSKAAPIVDDVAETAGKILKGPMGKKLALGAMGPVGAALGTAQDAMASEDVGAGSDIVDPYMAEEALLENAPENFADKDVSDQARRWQKIKSISGN